MVGPRPNQPLPLCGPCIIGEMFRTNELLWIRLASLRSKRFQSSYCAKVRAGAKKKGGRGRRRGEEEKLTARQNRSHNEQITPGLPDL